VIVPVYNEEHRLPETLGQITEYLSTRAWNWEVRVVDDGSLDGTARVAEAFSRTYDGVVLQSEPHRGKGAAVRSGILAAQGDYRFICDADLSMPILELARFMPPLLTGFDIAIGSRQGAGARRVGEPAHRHVVGRLFNQAVKRMLLGGIEDTQCGFKMFSARAADAIFPLMTVDGWAFDIEALYIARQHGLRIVEVPIVWHYRERSQVRILRDGLSMLSDVLRIRRRAARGAYRPPR
jgi:dolichyl-phosphate beta-glucosyltransferase